MLTKQCARCKKIIPYGLRYCEACQPIAEEQAELSRAKRAGTYNKGRDKQSKAFYNSTQWVMLSRTRLQHDEYRCQVCGEIATEVHHKEALRDDWDKRFDFDNLMSVCVSCHNKLDKRF